MGTTDNGKGYVGRRERGRQGEREREGELGSKFKGGAKMEARDPSSESRCVRVPRHPLKLE